MKHYLLPAIAALLVCAGPAFPILALDGPPSLDIAMTLLGNALYFNDDGPETGDGRARRAMVVWSR